MQENVAFLCHRFAIATAEFAVVVDSQRSPVLQMQQFPDTILCVCWQHRWMGNVRRRLMLYSHHVRTVFGYEHRTLSKL